MPEQYGLIANLLFLVILYLFIWLVTRNAFSFAFDSKKLFDRRRSGNSNRELGMPLLRKTDGSVYRLDEEILLVGRSSNCHVKIADEFTSQHHATIRKAGFAWLLEDEQSTNGTFVNGKKIAKKTYLNYGDTIVFGRTGFKLERG